MGELRPNTTYIMRVGDKETVYTTGPSKEGSLRKRAGEAARREYAQGEELGDCYLQDAYVRGYLAHAAQQPSRGQIEAVIGGAANPSQAGFGVVGIVSATDAVLRLLDGEADA